MNDHVLLNISTVTGKWFRKFVFNFNLTGVKHDTHAVLGFRSTTCTNVSAAVNFLGGRQVQQNDL